LSFVGRGKGIPLLFQGVELKDIHQVEKQVGVKGEGGKVEDQL